MADLYKIAEDIAQLYTGNPKVEAVLLGGSVSRAWQDNYSDIELLVFWRQAPTNEDRNRPIHQVNGTILAFHSYEDEEWSESYETQGIKLEISNFLTATIHRFIDDTIQFFNTNHETQCIAAALAHGVAFSNERVITEMKKRVENYPLALRQTMITANIDFGSAWSNREALLYRKDWLMLYKVMADVQIKIMSILFGLNCQYVFHPSFKWQRNSLDGMTIKPGNTAARLESVFLGNPQEAVRELETIIAEILKLVDCELPEMNLVEAKKQAEQLRPRNNAH